MSLSHAQIDQLLKPINPLRVSKDGKGFSHVEAYDIRAHMNRIFGFGGWSAEILSCDLVFESHTEAEKPRWTVCYRATCRVTVAGASYVDVATGDATNMPSRADAHDMACKTAASQALKRAAVNLGDQFGLSLYNKGSMRPLVQAVIGYGVTDESSADVSGHITTPLAPENSEPENTQREVSSPAPSTPTEAEVESTPPAGDDDEFTLICGQLNAVVLMHPDQAMQTITRLMQESAKHKLNNRKVPDDPQGRTLGAKLQAALKWAAGEQKKGAAA